MEEEAAHVHFMYLLLDIDEMPSATPSLLDKGFHQQCNFIVPTLLVPKLSYHVAW
jgi:hypothetical protein